MLRKATHQPNMNRVLLGISVLLMTIWTSQAAEPCPEKICQLVDCAPIQKSECQGVFIKNGGFCGCCDACYKAIEPGQPCKTLDLSHPPVAVCKSGYFCSYGICRPLLG